MTSHHDKKAQEYTASDNAISSNNVDPCSDSARMPSNLSQASIDSFPFANLPPSVLGGTETVSHDSIRYNSLYSPHLGTFDHDGTDMTRIFSNTSQSLQDAAHDNSGYIFDQDANAQQSMMPARNVDGQAHAADESNMQSSEQIWTNQTDDESSEESEYAPSEQSEDVSPAEEAKQATVQENEPGRSTQATVPVEASAVVTEIGDFGILTGRGGQGNNNHGNKLYRKVVFLTRPTYQSIDPSRKRAKTAFSLLVVDYIHEQGGRFLTKSGNGRYKVLKRGEARKKVAQALRETKPLKWINVDMDEASLVNRVVQWRTENNE